MGIARHPSKHTSKPWSLLLALTLLPGVVTSLEAQDKAIRPNKYACPVTADLFPEQQRDGAKLRFIFPEDLGRIPEARRISIATLTPETKDIEIAFVWIAVSAWPRESVVSGTFFVKADGSPNCYFLGSSAGLPLQVPCREFILTIPPGIEVKEVLFSSLGGEYISQDCPWPALEKEIREAFKEIRASPQDKSITSRFLSLLEEALPESDCVPKDGGDPVPALLLGELDDIWKWIDHLYLEVDRTNDHALRVFAEIYNILGDGVLAEVMDDQIWHVLRNRPRFILRKWDGIKNHRRNILASRRLQDPESIDEMIGIYRDISIKEPKYRTACEEIIGILSEKDGLVQTSAIGPIILDKLSG
jgi:hypothetical protein